ncbi:hypothetical protein [Ruminiclostridium cellulolyticum]|uniref:Uncharacterized protein n=1 Tax=Ruminiclostridium cellulolyticum (strain ATCC 35319 / DSM 5812 / JCM 6584 / H10) TaxID=394503 RepID=B8I1F3_RUMCH|nr:hypothetical protein [Ruminiclostridium cellulolyticum]ACL75751.1 conserved hypothetical protein [Ruminiclostridium cellulolyticum H10]
MKLRITDKDLAELTLEQKQNLCDLWIPQAYDVAVANVCVDAAEEKYKQITFIIGGLNLTKHNDIVLYDMKFLPDNLFTLTSENDSDRDTYPAYPENPRETEDSVEDSEDTLNDDFSEDFSIDEDFSFELQRPESFNKQDCLPLLDIGQMIDILERKNFGDCEFLLSVAFDDKIFDLGNNNSLPEMYSNENNKCELCDILWLSLKAVL